MDRTTAHELAQAVGLVAASTDKLTAACATQLEIGVTDLRAMYIVNASDQISVKEIGRILGITSGSTTPLVDRLAGRGFIRRSPHPTDRRSTVLELTPAGRHAVAWIADHFDQAMATAFADLDAEELGRFQHRLRHVCAALDDRHRAT